MDTTDRQTAPMSVPGPPNDLPPPVDSPAPRPSLVRWGDTVVGAAVVAEEATAGLIAGLCRAAARRAQRAGELAERGAGELGERGAAERARWRRRAGAAAE